MTSKPRTKSPLRSLRPIAQHLFVLDTTVVRKSCALGYGLFSDNAFDLCVLNRPFIPKVIESIQPTERVIIDVADAQTSPGSRDITRPQIVNCVDIENWSASDFPTVIHSAHKASDQRFLSPTERDSSGPNHLPLRSPRLLILCNSDSILVYFR
jgi:hypothetical protein